MYLLPSSCHPAHTTNSIPYSLALRIVRISSREEDRDLRLEELKVMLLNRDYKASIVNNAIRKAKEVPRKEALKRVMKEKEVERRPVMVTTYDPRLPSISSIVNKHWWAMCREDPYLKEVFPKPPLVAYRRQKTTGNHLVRAKLPDTGNVRSKRKLPGMYKCLKSGRECSICPWILETKVAAATNCHYK